MISKLVECVPNFSEGRKTATINAITDTILSIPGILLLDSQSDADHNRSVITFAGPPDRVVEAAVRCTGKSAELIDLNQHRGVHPRTGACDVIPFVPLRGVALEDCARLAASAGEQIWQQYSIPAYLYEAAARRPERTNLFNIRRDQFEGLSEEVKGNPDRQPDIGGPGLHPTAGATSIGARKIMVAFNVQLNTTDAAIAREIARKIRFSSGGLPYVKAMGVPLASRGCTQVSMNLTDFEVTPLYRVVEAVRREAELRGISIVCSEIVGLIPQKALEAAADSNLQLANFHPGMILENRLAEVAR